MVMNVQTVKLGFILTNVLYHVVKGVLITHAIYYQVNALVNHLNVILVRVIRKSMAFWFLKYYILMKKHVRV
jgi:hypothetical protein